MAITHSTRHYPSHLPQPTYQTMRIVACLTALFAVSCGGSSTQPSIATPQTSQPIVIPCDIVGTLPCQIPPTPQPAPKPVPTAATVSGTVTDGTSGGILPGIRIVLSTGNLTAVTDASGHYTAANVPLGQLTITAAAASYLTVSTTVTVAADLTVDLVLLRIASPPPGPAPTPTHGGIDSDTITVAHEFLVGTPVPTSSSNLTYCCWPFPVMNPGTYDFSLSAFPLDNLPSGGSTPIISASEMILAGIRFTQPSTTITTSTWHRVALGLDTQIAMIATGRLAHSTAFSFIGHFSWEITVPGVYYVIIDTEWGSARLNFVVR